MFTHLNIIQMMWSLVRSSWILHASCNKRKVAPIAALLSSVLHSSLFADERMHTTHGAPGPLKWVCGLSLSLGAFCARSSVLYVCLCQYKMLHGD